MRIRIFLAIFISKGLKRKLSNWKKDNKNLPVRWVKEKNLHITLTAPFYIDTNEVKKVRTKLRSLSTKFTPFELKFTGISLGPNMHQRLIWLEGEECRKIIKLKSEIDELLHVFPEKRKYRPHLTLARFNKDQLKMLKRVSVNEKVDWNEPVKAFSLVQSHLLKDGAKYSLLEKFLL